MAYLSNEGYIKASAHIKNIHDHGHSKRVAYYAVKIGTALNLPQDKLELLRVSGIFHDIGKIYTSSDILFKTGKLNDEEYNEIKKHPVSGANLLAATPATEEIITIIKYHHERVDGNGYPEGLKGDQIPYMSRIIAVADAFDAMMSDRSYRPRLDFEEAKAQLEKGAGTQFDKGVTDKFITILKDYDEMVVEIAAFSV